MKTLEADNFDLLVIGGGLAGSCLALQLLRKNSALSIAVIDKREFPLEQGSGTVGESLVEVATHYLSSELGLKDHLETKHLPKLGLRYFLESKTNQQIEDRLEVGANRYAPTPSYQIDRARLETFIWKEIEQFGGVCFPNSDVRDIELTSENCDSHSVIFLSSDGAQERVRKKVKTRWLVDASGRTSMLIKKNQLKCDNQHYGNAAWWKIKGDFPIDHWCNKEEWKRNNQGEFARWFSTNHLMGEGYWVWIIPLPCGLTSFGIVADAELHPYIKYNTYERMLEWLQEHEPQLAKLCRENQEQVQDFRAIKNYSYGTKQVFSKDRWVLTGEAGGFIDPFYSPGSDFIAIINSYISDLVLRDFAGERVSQRLSIYNELYLTLFNSSLTTFREQYSIIGNPLLTPIKVFWDWSYYWHFLARLFFENKLCDLQFIVKNKNAFEEYRQLNEQMQGVFRNWNKVKRPEAVAGFLDLAKHPFLFDLNESLSKTYEEGSFGERFLSGLTQLKSIAAEIIKEFNSQTGEDFTSSLIAEDTIRENIFEQYFHDLNERMEYV